MLGTLNCTVQLICICFFFLNAPRLVYVDAIQRQHIVQKVAQGHFSLLQKGSNS